MTTDIIRGQRATMNMVIDYPCPQELLERIDLPKKVKVATGCQYCDLDNYTKRESYEYDDYSHDAYYVVAEAPWTSLMMTYNSKTGKYGIVANGDYSPEVNIEFCPFCGRKLTDKKDDRHPCVPDDYSFEVGM